MSNVLTKIVNSKAAHIAALKQRFGEQLSPKISQRSLYEALNQPQTGFILECKKASPSKGLIRESFNLEDIAPIYARYASAISVLTDEQYFQGDMAYVAQVRELVEQPILCKDFFVDVYQVQLAAQQGADAILLMLSVLDDQQYQQLATEAARYQLDILTEVSNQSELERAMALKAQIIGINNRNLRDLSTDLEMTEMLAPQIPSDTLVISESGIYTHQDVRRLDGLANGFLVGSSLMAQADLDFACRQLIFGNNKICGLTRAADLTAAAQAGAIYGGLIFAEKSPRQLTISQAQALVNLNQTQVHQLKMVGVFVNESASRIASIAATLGLDVVQLHGQEDAALIAELRSELPESCLIWKAVAIDSSADAIDLAQDFLSPQAESAQLPQGADRYLYDTRTTQGFGGTGETFDWQRPLPMKAQAMLAGGLNADNALLAADSGFFGLDFNSGLEASAGIKDHHLIEICFHRLRLNERYSQHHELTTLGASTES